MFIANRTRWARTRLTPFCLTWGERASAPKSPPEEAPIDEAKTSPRLKSGPILLATKPQAPVHSSS
jgi:hypothetical protein